jgi:hypothetical protein
VYRTQDVEFVTYLTAINVKWEALELDSKGRVDFIFSMTREQGIQYRVDYVNSAERNYAGAYDLVMKTIKEVKRNRQNGEG